TGPPAITALRRVGALIVTVAPMPTHYRRPNPDRRRALELLAGSRYGYTKAILRAHGFSIDMMVELVKARTRNHEARAHGRRRSTDRRCARADHGGRPASARKDVQVSLGNLDPYARVWRAFLSHEF